MPNSYTVEEKISVITWHKKNGANFHATSRHFNIDRKQIREWILKEKELLQNDHGLARKKRKLGSGRSSLSKELDDSLFEFLDTERAAGHAVSNKRLQEEALRLAEKIGLENFKASDMFINRWKKRFNVPTRMATKESQKTPEQLKESTSDLKTVNLCRICIQHFSDDVIKRESTFVDSSGETIRLPMTRLKLTEGAVPTIFPVKMCECIHTNLQGSGVPKQEKIDNIPLEPTVEIKEEPLDYYPTPSTSTATASEEFILPHEDHSWTTPNAVVEPQFTLSVASLGSTSAPDTNDSEQPTKKRKTNDSKITAHVPPTNGLTTSSEGSEKIFSELSNSGSSMNKDQFDVFGEYIAAKLRNLDRVSCAFTQKAIADIIFEAEMGKYLNQTESAKS